MYYIADWKCPSHSTIVILNCHNSLAKSTKLLLFYTDISNTILYMVMHVSNHRLSIEMGRNRYRVLEVLGIGSFLKYRYRRKIRYRYRVLFDTISILFRYFTCTCTIISCNGIQRVHNNLRSLFGTIS